MFERTTRFCDLLLDMGVPGFDLVVLKDGKPILRYMNGYSDIENKIEINGKEKYNIYSCSKVITCAAALQLWEKGLFSLEDKLSDYMPEFEVMKVKTDSGITKAEKPILIKHLFEMTAGFSYDLNSESLIECRKATDGRCPTRETMKYLAKEPLLFEPGTRWEYSLCHDVLAALVEAISGEKFEEYVKKNIFDVLGMDNSTFMLPQTELSTVAQQYKFMDDRAVNIGKQIMNFKIGTEYASGGAGCISTTEDYIKFLEGLRCGIILNPQTLQLMTTDRLTDAQKTTYWSRESHGYGLGVRCHSSGEINTDFGWGGAAGAYAAVDIKSKLSIYFSTHLHSSPGQGVRSLLYRFIRAELFDSSDFENIKNDIEGLYDYDLTY